MRLLQWLQDRLGFTRNELLVVFLLTGTLFAGGIMKSLRNPSAFPVAAPDYTAADSQFAAGARAFHESIRNTRTPDARPVPPAARGVVDLNSASAHDLEMLPGIGPALAGRIVQYRAAHGQFRTVDELLRVKGIGARTLARLRPRVKVARNPSR